MIPAAISEEEFYGESSRSRADTNDSHQSAVRIHAPSSPPSPQSLQPQLHLGTVDDSTYNPHKTLTHVSSLSAPEVNQVNSVADRMQNPMFRKYLKIFLLDISINLNCFEMTDIALEFLFSVIIF